MIGFGGGGGGRGAVKFYHQLVATGKLGKKL